MSAYGSKVARITDTIPQLNPDELTEVVCQLRLRLEELSDNAVGEDDHGHLHEAASHLEEAEQYLEAWKCKRP